MLERLKACDMLARFILRFLKHPMGNRTPTKFAAPVRQKGVPRTALSCENSRVASVSLAV